MSHKENTLGQLLDETTLNKMEQYKEEGLKKEMKYGKKVNLHCSSKPDLSYAEMLVVEHRRGSIDIHAGAIPWRSEVADAMKGISSEHSSKVTLCPSFLKGKYDRFGVLRMTKKNTGQVLYHILDLKGQTIYGPIDEAPRIHTAPDFKWIRIANGWLQREGLVVNIGLRRKMQQKMSKKGYNKMMEIGNKHKNQITNHEMKENPTTMEEAVQREPTSMRDALNEEGVRLRGLSPSGCLEQFTREDLIREREG